MKKTKDHWDNVYKSKSDSELSWFKETYSNSLKLISSSEHNKSAKIIDIGSGTSNLVDDLLGYNYKNISVVDISKQAINPG
ncbi:MAG: SAM-dependent methyltransferase, partial [Alphaproteobacteria bacterium]|nr:SAM-dependent methyltransferase [Alphaproteobacteria bacterium]